MTRTELVREGDPAPDGVGALRRFAFGPGASEEEVVTWEPPRHLGYIVVRGLPVRSYRADVHLDEDGAGTVVTWRCSVEALVPGTGAALAFGLRRIIGGFATRLCRHADGAEAGGS